jgi:hypothetical protein
MVRGKRQRGLQDAFWRGLSADGTRADQYTSLDTTADSGCKMIDHHVVSVRIEVRQILNSVILGGESEPGTVLESRAALI